MSWAALLTHQAQVYRAAVSQTAQGDEVRTWAPVGVPVACLVQPGGGRWVQTDRGIEKQATWRLFALLGVDVQEADRVIANGEAFTVTVVNRFTGTRLDHLEVGLERGPALQGAVSGAWVVRR